jgi:Rod binding domain-containing protein
MATGSTLGPLSSSANLLQSREDSMMKSVNSSGGKSDDARIDKSAQEFESILLGSWLQQAQQSFATVPGAEDDDDAGTREQTMSFGMQSLATSIAASGGIGIAKMVAKALHAKADGASDATSSGTTSPEQAQPARIAYEKARAAH